MKYCFKSSITNDGEQKVISIPFNVWEICFKKEALTVDVTIANHSFSCDLLDKGKGFYHIPVTDDLSKELGDSSFDVSFQILNIESATKESPYNVDNPIRKVDSINLVKQPFDGLCGQTCVAMLADVTLEEACEIMHCRDWQASMAKVIDTLDYLFIPHADTIYYTEGEIVTLPKCAILMEKMGRYSHYLIYFDGTYYDPTTGIREDFNQKNMVGYLEIITS